MADTTYKPESSIPIPPRPSARPEGAIKSEATAQGASTPPKMPAGRANEGSSSPASRKSASEGNGGPAQAESSGGNGNERDQAHSTGSGMVTMAGAGIKKTRERVEDQIYSQRDRVTGGVRTLSRALRGAGGMLDEDELVARGLHYASEKVETVAGYVGELTPKRLANDLRSVSHSQPAWFFGGAFLLGLTLGRFARSTASAAASARSPASPS